MKSKIASGILCTVIMVMNFSYAMQVDNGALRAEKKSVQKKRNRNQNRRKRKNVPVVKEVIVDEEPIENIDAFVNEFDHVGKQQAVNALLERAIDFCRKNDLKTICHAFTHTKNFVEGALYPFLIDTRGIVYAHGDELNLLWKNLWDEQDMFGAYTIQSMVKLARAGGGILAYEWDGAVKVSTIQRIDIEGKEFVLGCGYFPHSKEYAVIGLVKGAVALFNQYVAQGRNIAGAFGDMSYPLSPQFLFGDLYLFALDFDGIIRAQGDRTGLIGSSALAYKDAQGKQYNAQIIEELKKKEEGEGIWIDYISKRALKHAYAEKVKDSAGKYYFIACGYYPEITRETTVDLVRRGYQLMKSSGLATAIKAFNNEQEQDYRYGDLGLFVYDMNGTCLAQGRRPDDVGQNQLEIKDEDGRFYVKEMINQAKVGPGWVSFKINNSFQSTYVEKVDLGIGEFVIGAGMFPVSKPETMRLLVKSALGYLNGHSMDELLERLVNRNDQFLRGDLFLYVFDMSGYCYGWGDNYNLIWRNLLNWKDENGKPFIKQMIDAAQHGPDHIIVKMNNRQRVNYFEPVQKDGKKYIIGSGFYK